MSIRVQIDLLTSDKKELVEFAGVVAHRSRYISTSQKNEKKTKKKKDK